MAIVVLEGQIEIPAEIRSLGDFRLQRAAQIGDVPVGCVVAMAEDLEDLVVLGLGVDRALQP